MIVLLLAMQSATIVSASDRTSFEDYRQCVLTRAREATLKGEPRVFVDKAGINCRDELLAAAFEMAADDLEGAGDPATESTVDSRVAMLTDELVEEVRMLWQGKQH